MVIVSIFYTYTHIVSFWRKKMVIFIKLKKIKTIFLIISFIIMCQLGIYLWNQPTIISALFVNKNTDEILDVEIQKMFNLRNKALLEKNTDILANLYNRKVRYGIWAYEHELKKMKYLHKWSDKQSVKFKKIDSLVIIRNAKRKEEGFTVNLLVSTEYKYAYIDTPSKYDSFRIGTYHSLDLMPNEEEWVITREWYTDPFADSLHLEEIKSEEIKQIIISGKTKDLPTLSDRRINAVAYADMFCGAASLPQCNFQYNPKYRNYNSQGGDCTNFASQILYEGGKFSKNRTWNYERGSGSKAWVNAHVFNNYMIYSGRASVIAHGTYDRVLKASYKLLPGDYIAYEKKGKIAHISIVTGVDSKGYTLVNSHNSDRYRVPWDLGWSNKGIKFWLVCVHY